MPPRSRVRYLRREADATAHSVASPTFDASDSRQRRCSTSHRFTEISDCRYSAWNSSVGRASSYRNIEPTRTTSAPGWTCSTAHTSVSAIPGCGLGSLSARSSARAMVSAFIWSFSCVAHTLSDAAGPLAVRLHASGSASGKDAELYAHEPGRLCSIRDSRAVSEGIVGKYLHGRHSSDLSVRNPIKVKNPTDTATQAVAPEQPRAADTSLRCRWSWRHTVSSFPDVALLLHPKGREGAMRIRITRPWRVKELPFATLDAGKVFDVPSRVALYFRAMHCAEPVRERPHTVRRKPNACACRRGPLWRLGRDGSMAEARIRIAGHWHRLRVEFDAVLMRACTFYLDHGNTRTART